MYFSVCSVCDLIIWGEFYFWVVMLFFYLAHDYIKLCYDDIDVKFLEGRAIDLCIVDDLV